MNIDLIDLYIYVCLTKHCLMVQFNNEKIKLLKLHILYKLEITSTIETNN